jgi:hypothetical protein
MLSGCDSYPVLLRPGTPLPYCGGGRSPGFHSGGKWVGYDRADLTTILPALRDGADLAQVNHVGERSPITVRANLAPLPQPSATRAPRCRQTDIQRGAQ